jgi:hypothetical protein
LYTYMSGCQVEHQGTPLNLKGYLNLQIYYKTIPQLSSNKVL